MRQTDEKPKDMLGRGGVLPLAEALELLEKNQPTAITGEENLPLDQALGRCICRAVCSPEDLPPFCRSTMDGYAVRAQDTFGAAESLPAYFKVSGGVCMGEYPEEGPAEGCCFAIPTGGFLPPRTDAVVMLEHTVQVDEQMIEVVRPVATGANCIAAGEDISKGDLLFPVGHRLRPQELGLLAGLGICAIDVFRRVKVGVISTGDEVVDYHQTPAPGMVRDMNAIHLGALVTQTGAIAKYYGIVADEEEKFQAVIKEALADNDVVLFSGSSSVGSRDMGGRVIAQVCEPGIVFHGVAVKPGKPVIFALAGLTPVFGLPGHPVSAAVAFRLFVVPVLRRLSGRPDRDVEETKTISARLMRNISSAAGRTDFIRVQITRNVQKKIFEAQPVLGKSGALFPLVKADGEIMIAEEKQGLQQGEIVDVRLYE